MSKNSDYKNIILEKSNNSISLLNESNDKNIVLKCNVCGKTFEAEVNSFLKNPVCPNKRCMTREDKIKQIEEQTNGEYIVINKFLTLDRKSKEFQKVMIKHKKCGNEYTVAIRNFLKGRRCPYCTKTPFKTHEEYVNDIKEVGNGKFSVESQYTRASEDVLLNHSGGCKESFIIKAGAFLSDPRCPLCEKSESKKKTRDDYRQEVEEYKSKNN